MKSIAPVYLFLLLLLASCYGIEKPSKPDNLLSEDKMVDVLVEINLMSSAKGINKRELENRGIVPDTFIYNKHKIDSTQFANSNNFYAYDIEKYDKIYTRVKDSLEALRAFYKEKEKRIEEEKQKKLKREKRSEYSKKTMQIDSTIIPNNLPQNK